MNTKEAIQKVKDKYEGWQGYARTQKEFDELGKERDKVIALLKRGEKYKAMWKKFKKFFNLMIAFKRGTFEHLEKLEIFIKDIEQKYFPKGDD